MAIRFNNEDLIDFFGQMLESPDVAELVGRMFLLQYQGGRLRYELIIDSEREIAVG